MYFQDLDMARKLKNVENDIHTLQDLEYGETSEKHGNWDTLTLRPRIWRETLKNVQNEKHTLGPGIWRETVKNVKNEK